MGISIGIDVAEARKGLDLVALNDDRTLVVQRAHATVLDIVEIIHELQPDVVCIDSPPNWATVGRSRAAERHLGMLGISAFRTPTDPGEHAFYQWMRVGFSIFTAISHTYPRYRTGSVHGTAVEVFPEASAVLLAGRLRGQDDDKRDFRRTVLTENGMDSTVFKTIDAVDAALAALTGVLALGGQFSAIGDADEGVIVVPVKTLPAQPLRRSRDLANTKKGPITAPVPLADERRCLCGCQAPVRRRFLPGHDAKLKSNLLARHQRGEADATDQLQSLVWLP